MKKILAFVLATIMVLSLVPASAFAAFTKCPATHTSTNCDCTQVGQPVAATCENVGYTVYVCNDCGEQFVDNYVQKLEHTLVSDEELAAGDIKASCIYQKDGVAYLECTVCEGKFVENYKWNSTEVHDVYYVSGVGCEKLYACSICNAQGYLAVDEDGDTVLSDEAAHNYTFTKVEVEPKRENGKASIGKALFTCTDIVDKDGKVLFEGCGALKQVDIETPSCTKHTEKYWDNFKLVQAAVAPTCTTDGYYLVVKCPDCNKHYVDYDEDNDPKTKKYVALDDVNDDDAIDKKDALISKLGHTSAPTGVNCQGTYVCTRCSATVSGPHAYGSWITVSERNCLAQLYRYRICNVPNCGHIKTETKAAQGHKTKKQFISATCALQGGYYEYCERGNCPLPKSTITDPVTGVSYTRAFTGKVTYIGVNPEGHILEKSNVGSITSSDMYCEQAGYYIVTCKNNCAAYAGGKIELVSAKEHTKYIYKQQHNYTKATTVGTDVFHAYTTRTIYKCAKCSWESTPVDVIDSTIKNTFSTVEEALVYHGFATAIYKYDKKKTQVIDHYEGRDVTLDEALKKFLPQGSTVGSCTVDKIETYFCVDCGNYVYINKGKTPHSEGKMTEGYPSTCTKPGMRDTYVCTDCGVTFWYDAKGKQQTSSPVIKPCAGNVDKNGDPIALLVKTDCSDDGTEYYQCSECNTCYTKADCATPYIPVGHKYTYLLTGKAATCNTAGLPEIRYCSVCKELEINTVYEVAGEEVRINFNANDIKYKDADVVVALTKDDYLSADVVVTVSKAGTVSFNYLSITQYVWPADVTVIKMEAIPDYIYGSSKKQHWAPYVDSELASDVVDASDVTWKKSIKESTTTDKTKDHTKPSFKLNYCEACNYEFISSYKAATGGHINSKDSILTTDCSNEGVPGDRICVVCDQEILVDHEWSETKGNSTATCIKTGVSYKYCTECGHYEFSGDIVLPDAKKFHTDLLAGKLWDEDKQEGYKPEPVGTVLDYAHNGASYLACPECKVALTEYEEKEMKANGLEIYLTTDAESYIPGSKVYVTVSLDSLNGVNVWGLNFPVSFDPEVFKFNGYKFNTAESAFQTFAVNEVAGGYEWSNDYPPCDLYGMLSTGKKGPSGVVSIVANADANVLVKGSQDLVVLEFVIISAEATTKQFRVGDASVLDIKLGQKLKEIDPDTVSTWAELYTVVRGSQSYRHYNVEVINANGRAVDVLKNDENYSNKIEITGFLDLVKTDDEGITMADAYALYSLIYNNEYDVQADADFDGYVTAKDLSILYAILTGVVTVEQLVTPDAELPAGWEAWMGAK